MSSSRACDVFAYPESLGDVRWQWRDKLQKLKLDLRYQQHISNIMKSRGNSGNSLHNDSLKFGCPKHDLVASINECISQYNTYDGICNVMNSFSLCNGYSIDCQPNFVQRSQKMMEKSTPTIKSIKINDNININCNNMQSIRNCKSNSIDHPSRFDVNDRSRLAIDSKLDCHGLVSSVSPVSRYCIAEKWSLSDIGLTEQLFAKSHEMKDELNISICNGNSTVDIPFHLIRCANAAFIKRIRPREYKYDGSKQRVVPQKNFNANSNSNSNSTSNEDGNQHEQQHHCDSKPYLRTNYQSTDTNANKNINMNRNRNGDGSNNNNNNRNRNKNSNNRSVNTNGKKPFRWNEKQNQLGTWVCISTVLIYMIILLLIKMH